MGRRVAGAVRRRCGVTRRSSRWRRRCAATAWGRRRGGQRALRQRLRLGGRAGSPPRRRHRRARLDDPAGPPERILMTLTLSNHLAADSAYHALRRDVVEGLQKAPKSLPPKWFY